MIPRYRHRGIRTVCILHFAFTLSDTHIYFVGLGNDARPHAFRCPIDGCTGGPQRISAAGDRIDILYTDIELAGDEVFWIERDNEIWRANIAGAEPGRASEAWSALGSARLWAGLLRSDDGSVYAVSNELRVNNVPHLIEIPGDGGDAVEYSSKLAALASVNQLDTPVFDIRGGSIAAWNGRGNNEPRPLYSIAGGDAQMVANATDLYKNSLVRFGSQIAWVDDKTLSTCGLGVSCDAPYVVSSQADALAAGGTTLYFIAFEGGGYRLKSCPGLDLLSGACTPANLSIGFDWAGASELRVNADPVYAVTQFGSLIRVHR